MVRSKAIKIAMIAGSILAVLLWVGSSSLSKAIPSLNSKTQPGVKGLTDDYVGSETCKLCHEDQFKAFSNTQHAKLSSLASWKEKVTGCEQCHGPGKAHVDGGGDMAKIISFKSKSSKEVSKTCLTCHADDEHNNFLRGAHWVNGVGCTDCHSPHDTQIVPTRSQSIAFIAKASELKPDASTLKMLKTSQPQLCIGCHTEVKAQFSMPFHHRVLEGQIKCYDCHNPHGGFEMKQTRLAVGADVPCLKCHTNKQGPFVFEHAPLKVEGCAICHNPHGSANPRLLKRSQVRQLCLECHSNIFAIGAPDTPSFHNQATVRFQNCSTCHSRIHGSNVSNRFFR
jgi:predicted CXXCH cytochrome family protein